MGTPTFSDVVKPALQDLYSRGAEGPAAPLWRVMAVAAAAAAKELDKQLAEQQKDHHEHKDGF